MNAVSVIMLVFSVLGALDRIFGNRLGLGKEFEKGFMIFGSIALSMIGMIVLAPVIAQVLEPVFDWIYTSLGVDPSIIPASLFACDMGGASVAFGIARSGALGRLNGMVVSSMMGCMVSFTIPVALTLVAPQRHRELFLGLACGIAAIPAGCIAAGFMLGAGALELMINMLPLAAFSALCACGLIFAPELTVKVFSAFGVLIRVLIGIGLVLGLLEHFAGIRLIDSMGSIGEAGQICFGAVIVLSGAFPLMAVVSRLLRRPLGALGKLAGINEKSTMGFLSTIVTSITTFESMGEMDEKGAILNSAFAVSAAFVFGGQLAFTMAFDQGAVSAFIVGKLVSGICGLTVAMIFCKTSRRLTKNT
ncbi:MAG: ethanolamine utilization protein EutH [Clostridia bacterium]|nr:ethanolamine utilization protein EutH [Clostridia bacterium]